MYGQKTHLNEAVHLTGYVCDMLLRARMNSHRFLACSQMLILLA